MQEIQHRAGRGLPGAVRGDYFGGAVRVLHVELGESAFGAEPLHAVRLPPFWIGIEPAVAQHNAQDIGAGGKGRGKVVGVVEHPSAVVGLRGRQHTIADAPAVARRFIVAEAGDVESRLSHRAPEHELLPQQRGPSIHLHLLVEIGELVGAREEAFRRARLLRRPTANPSGLPILGVEQAHLPGGGRAPSGSAPRAVPHASLPVAAQPGSERGAAISDVGGVAGLHPARVPQIASILRQQFGAGRDEHLIGGLANALSARPNQPAQLRVRLINAQRILEILALQVRKA